MKIKKIPISYRASEQSSPLKLVSKFLKTLKSFAQAFSKACGFQRQSLWWVLRATPLTFFASKAVDFVHRLILSC